MILLNLSHPLTDAQVAQIEALAGQPIARLIELMPQFENGAALLEQVRALADHAGLSSREWQTEPLLVNLPGLAPAAACLLAEIHARSGHFPAIVRIREVAGSIPTSYEVAEVIDLQAIREEARKRR